MKSRLILLGLMLALALPLPGRPQQLAEPTNVLLIYVDDLGYGDLGSYGHTIAQTPNLDQLAAEGLRFTSYYAPSPLCSPSRAGLLTGRTPFRTGIESWIPPETDVQLGPDELTIATLLEREGYDTFMAGKWHLSGGLERTDHTNPGDHGFDHWLALHAWPVPHNRNPTNFWRNGDPLGEVEGFTSQIVVDESIDWLQGRESQAPFFMYVSMIEPHSTIANPDEFNAMYSQYTRGTPDPLVNGLPEPPDNIEARGPGEYWANITTMDHYLGRLLESIDEMGLRDSTLVIFASDNGPVTTDWRHWWEVNLYGDTGGFRGRKADLWEGGIRVPAMIRWPGRVSAGTTTDVPVSGTDLLPTLAAIVGFGAPEDRPIDGEDLSPLLYGRPFERTTPLYWEFDDDRGFHFALRDGDWKLFADESLERVELYDLRADRFEVFDRAAERPEVVASLLEKLRGRHDSVANDPLRPR